MSGIRETLPACASLTISAREMMALKALAQGCEDYGYFNFAGIAKRSGLEHHQVRRSVRALARKGLSEFGKGLWTDEGQPAGSGYRITEAGRAALQGSSSHLADANPNQPQESNDG